MWRGRSMRPFPVFRGCAKAAGNSGCLRYRPIMRPMPARAKLVATSQVVILVAALTGAALVSTRDQWEPLNLVAILLVLAVASDLLAVRTKQVHISAAFLCLVLAMAL